MIYVNPRGNQNFVSALKNKAMREFIILNLLQKLEVCCLLPAKIKFLFRL